ncbi:MAG: hypothetical protein F4097_04520, partial [Cenarchaeum sp. SB0672_bin_9]|nr:hypothetical protein [Cenarchaeum sp. SB0672_bin_9]
MKEKTFHALLLSIVMMAGAMTINDAFAQTNTERLITVTDTTEDTNTMVSNLVDLWSNFDSNFTPILSVIDALSGELSSVSDMVSSVSDDVTSVDSKIAAFESKFDEFAATDAANTVEAQANYDNFAQILPDIQSTVDMMVDDAGTSFDTISEKLDALDAQIGQFTNSITTLQDDVSEIQNELGIVQESVQQRVGLPPTDLHKGSTEEDVLLSWYTRGLSTVPRGEGDKSGEYTADFMFVCESDVFVETATSNLGKQTEVVFEYSEDGTKTSNVHPIYNSDDTAPADYEKQTTSLTVGGQTLFDSKFVINVDDIAVYDVDATLNLLELKAGSPLQFKSSVVDPNTYREVTTNGDESGHPGLLEYIVLTKKNSYIAINFTEADSALDNLANLNTTTQGSPHANATKSDISSIKAYTVTVNYFSADEEPECKILPSTTVAADKSSTITIVAKAEDGTGITRDYEKILDCDLQLTTITSITGSLTGADGLNNFVTMEMKVDDDTKAEFTFEDNKPVIKDESSLPFEFSGKNLEITGDIIDKASIVLQIDYETVETDGCIVD